MEFSNIFHENSSQKLKNFFFNFSEFRKFGWNFQKNREIKKNSTEIPRKFCRSSSWSFREISVEFFLNLRNFHESSIWNFGGTSVKFVFKKILSKFPVGSLVENIRKFRRIFSWNFRGLHLRNFFTWAMGKNSVDTLCGNSS